MEFKEFQLGDLVKYNNDKISVLEVKKENYISTENMLPDKKGIGDNAKLPEKGKVNVYVHEDILISNIRPYFKKIWFADNIGSHSTDVLNLRITSKEVLPKYLYYYVLQDRFFEYMTTSSKGTKMPRGDKQAIMKYPVFIPDISMQSKIVSILSNLDDKIQNNLYIIDNLEQISQTLFKHWFIDFEFPNEEGQPYKSSGGKMVESELGEIPEGWEVKYLKDILSKFSTGLNPRKNFVLGKGENYYVTIKNMGDNNVILDNKCDKVDDEAIKIINKRSDLKQKDVLFSGIGTIGRVYLIPEEPNNWNISESIFTLRAVNENDQLFLYNLLLSNELQEYAKQLSSGSVQKGIRKRDLEKYKFPYSGQINQKYQLLIEKLQNQIEITRIENKNLEQLRDTLLPKLLSGEIEIPDDLEV